MFYLSINSVFSQTNSIIRYYYNTYNGKPINNGWLMSDTSYKMIYDKINFQTKIIYTLKKIHELDSNIIDNQERVINVNNDVIVDLKLLNNDCNTKMDLIVIKADSIYNISQKKIDKKEHNRIVKRTVFQSASVGILVGVITTIYLIFKITK